MNNLKTKTCKCGVRLGQRVRTCPNCNFKFTFNKIAQSGKNCPECQESLKKRAKFCFKCSYIYPIKKSKRFEEISNWQSLKPGQIFFIPSNGKGPIYTNDNNKKFLMGYRGRFSVLDIKQDGIIARSFKEGGHCFIYMGKKQMSKKIENLLKRPHKIFKKV